MYNEVLKKKISLYDLNEIVILHILEYLTNSVDYNNFRISCKKFYTLINTIKKFENDKCIQEIFIKNQYYINKHYFKNSNLKLLNQFIIDSDLKKTKIRKEHEYYPNGSLKRISNYKNGFKEGLEKVYFDNYIVRRQSFYKNGIKIKNEFINDINGRLKYIIYYNFNTMYVKKYFKKMMCYDISIKNNSLHGECKYYIYGTLQKSINFNKGLLQGICKTYKIFGFDEIFTYDNNKKNGAFLCYDYLKNIKFTGNYYNDRLHGLVNYFVSNKIKKSINMCNGLINGKYIEYAELKKQYNFSNNKLNGYYKEYRYGNVLRLKIKFTDDCFDNIFKTYDINGNLDKEYFFIDDDYIVKKYINNNLAYSLFKVNNEYFLSCKNLRIKLL